MYGNLAVVTTVHGHDNSLTLSSPKSALYSIQGKFGVNHSVPLLFTCQLLPWRTYRSSDAKQLLLGIISKMNGAKKTKLFRRGGGGGSFI